MTLRLLILLALTGVALSACLPVDEEITSDNAFKILSGSKQADLVSNQVKWAKDNYDATPRFVSRAASVEPIDCTESGTFSYEPVNTSEFNLEFNDCTNAKGRINGTIAGSYSINSTLETVSFDFSAHDLETEAINGDYVYFDQITLATEFGTVGNYLYFDYAHNGTYDYDTSRYRGKVTVKTNETNHHVLSDPAQCTGNVTYTDVNGNTLTVDRNGAGIDTYFNDILLRSFNCNWVPTN